MPFSRSRSMESMTRSATSWCAPKEPVWRSMASTRVVMPWSTWATIATLRRLETAARADMELLDSFGGRCPARGRRAERGILPAGRAGGARAEEPGAVGRARRHEHRDEEAGEHHHDEGADDLILEAQARVVVGHDQEDEQRHDARGRGQHAGTDPAGEPRGEPRPQAQTESTA